MNEQSKTGGQLTALDPENTPQGAMERVFIAEVHSPGYSNYNAAVALEAMRNMRQAIENRLRNPGQYGARGARNEIDIIKAPNQIQGFGEYPNLSSDKQENIDNAVKYANDPHHAGYAAYAQFVENAIMAATEAISRPVALYPNATAWVTEKTQSPGSDFYPLGTVGGNTFYGTLPNPPHGAKPQQHAGNLEHMTPVEKLRHYAGQARAAAAAAKPMSEHMKRAVRLKTRLQLPSFAPIPGRQGAAPPPKPAHAAAELAERQLARASSQWRMDEMISARAEAGLALAGDFGAAQPAMDAGGALGQTGGQLLGDTPLARANRVSRHAALVRRRGLMDLPSFAPVGRPGPGRFDFPRAVSRAGVEEVATLQPVQMHPPGGLGARGGGISASASEVFQAGFAAAAAAVRERSVSDALREYFIREARLPPRGGAGFDPRLTPAWPGVKGS